MSDRFVTLPQGGGWREPGVPLGLGPSLYLRVAVELGRSEALADAVRAVVEPAGSVTTMQERWRTLQPFLRELDARAKHWYPRLQPVVCEPRVHPSAVDAPRHPHERADLFVITGYLGSGKTTLLNALLSTEALRDTLVMVNELGAIPLDHRIVSQDVPGGAFAVANGCLCCVVGDALGDGIRDAVAARNAGRMPWFSRIVVETSGGSDPVALVERVLHDRTLRDAVSYRGTIATMDVLAIADEGVLPGEVPRQLHLAQRVVLTKADCADAEALPSTLARVRALAPWAHVMLPRCGPDAAAELASWFALPETPMAPAVVPPPLAHDSSSSVVTFACGAVDSTGLRLFVDLMQLAKGNELYRMKGEVECTQGEGRHLLQGVRSSVRLLPPLADAAPGTRLTLIGRRLDARGVRRLFEALAAREPSALRDECEESRVHP